MSLPGGNSNAASALNALVSLPVPLDLPRRKRTLVTAYASSFPGKIYSMIDSGCDTTPTHVAYALSCTVEQLMAWATEIPEMGAAVDAAIGAEKIRLWHMLKYDQCNSKSIQFLLKTLGVLEDDIRRSLDLREREFVARSKSLDSEGRPIEIMFEEIQAPSPVEVIDA
jgi:hypothetical protein